MMKDLKKAALDYHAHPVPGKIATQLTKPAETAQHLALAYSPGVAEPVKEIYKNAEAAYQYTAKGNLVAVISNGSAILGLGNLGALASKPVLEGKVLLFKKFANIDAIDIEIDSDNPQAIIETVKRMAVSFGGINLEDIKAPECFEIERALIKACDIPVFHDDQHGTAVVVAAGLLNALELSNKTIDKIRLVCLGAGASGISCCELLIVLGLKPENLCVLDRRGVIYTGRGYLNSYKAAYAIDTPMRSLDDALQGADVLLGLAGPGLVQPEQIMRMAERPIIFACSNPDPEICPEEVLQARDDAIMATGRSDYPNQVNNVLGFPFIFRGALDARARVINNDMKIAAVHAIRTLAKESVTQEVMDAYNGKMLAFGRDYILPKPTDSRLLMRVAAAVAQAAVTSGVARQPYPKHYPPL